MSSFLRSTSLVCFLHPSQAVRFYCYWSPWFGYYLYCRCFSVRKLTASLLWSLLHSLAQFLPLHILITHWQRKLFDYFFSTTCLISIPGDTPNFKWWEWLNGGKIKTKNALGLPKKPPKNPWNTEFSVPFPENIKDITQILKTSEIECLCSLLVWASSETHNLQAVLFSSYLVHKSTAMVLGVPSGDRGNWE